MDIRKMLDEKVTLYDGSTGVFFQSRGLEGLPALYNAENREAVLSLHRAYLEAGSELVPANTFGANKLALEAHGLADRSAELCRAGMEIAREAAGERAIADVGPCGRLLEPAGDLSFEEAYEAYAEEARALAAAGAEYVQFETFTDLAELLIAMRAFRDNTDIGMLVSATFEDGCRTLSGNPPECVAIAAEALGAIAVGANCSGGPGSLEEPIERMEKVCALPLSAKPNAGFPETVDGKTQYLMTPEEFA